MSIYSECCICLNENIIELNKCLTNCNHDFCKICLIEWFSKGKTSCPLCRNDIDYFMNNYEKNNIIKVENPIIPTINQQYNNGNIYFYFYLLFLGFAIIYISIILFDNNSTIKNLNQELKICNNKVDILDNYYNNSNNLDYLSRYYNIEKNPETNILEIFIYIYNKIYHHSVQCYIPINIINKCSNFYL